MNKFELAKQYIEMYDSLAKSIQTAGGDFSLFDLKNMTVLELICALAPNGVRFYTEKQTKG